MADAGKRKGIAAFFPPAAKRHNSEPAVPAAAAGETPAEPAAVAVPVSAEERRVLLNKRVALARRANAKAASVVEAARAAGAVATLRSLLVDSEWGDALEAEFASPHFSALEQFLAREWAAAQVFPAPQHIFRAVRERRARQQRSLTPLSSTAAG